MANIQATCPTCGLVHLRETGVLLTLYDTGQGNYYTFFCPTCRTEIAKEAPVEVARLLMRAQVRVNTVIVPGEIKDGDRTGPALSYDDLLDFILELYDGEVIVPEVKL